MPVINLLLSRGSRPHEHTQTLNLATGKRWRKELELRPTLTPFNSMQTGHVLASPSVSNGTPIYLLFCSVIY